MSDTARDLLRETRSYAASLEVLARVHGADLSRGVELGERIDAYLRTPAQQDDALRAALRELLDEAWPEDARNDPNCAPEEGATMSAPIRGEVVLRAMAALEAHPPATDAGEALAETELLAVWHAAKTDTFEAFRDELRKLRALSARPESAGGTSQQG